MALPLAPRGRRRHTAAPPVQKLASAFLYISHMTCWEGHGRPGQQQQPAEPQNRAQHAPRSHGCGACARVPGSPSAPARAQGRPNPPGT
jgi:hypothetical protein